MKHLTFAGAAILWFAIPALAQPNPSGPVQLHNPHSGFGGGGVGGGFGLDPGAFGPGFSGAMPVQAPPPPPVTMLADGAYLFILRGDTLMQFDKKTLRLINSVELPHPTPPAPSDMATHTAPPLRRAPGFDMGHGPTF